MPLADGTFRRGAWRAENLACKSEDTPARPCTSRTPHSRACWRSACPAATCTWAAKWPWTRSSAPAARLRLFLSDNNGLDWKDVASIDKSGPQKIDLQKFVLRRYDYSLRFVLSGTGTGLESLKISQPDPMLAAGPAHAGQGREHDHLHRRPAGRHGHHRRHRRTATPRARTSHSPISIPR